MAALTLLGPALIFSYAAWQNHRTFNAQANERIERALDVLQEHALKAIQTVERSIAETNEVLKNLTDQQIRSSEADLFLRLKRTQQALPQIESIWAIDRDGHPHLSSTVFPVPRDGEVLSHRYFLVQKDGDVGSYISEVINSRPGTVSQFIVSARRQGIQAGRFDGVVSVSVMSQHFTEFYRKLSRGRDSFALVHIEGSYLARYPETSFERFAAPSEFKESVRSGSSAGNLTVTSEIDDIERRIGYRKIPDLPLYVSAGVETAALKKEFWNWVVTQFAVGFPAAVVMFGLAIYALRQARRFQEETARRKIVEVALEQAQRLEALGQLTGGVAHDFNNLLMIVSGSAHLLKRHLAENDRTARYLEAINLAVKRGSSLTRQLLSFSRRQTHEGRVVDLKEHLPILQSMLQSSLRGDIRIEIDIPDDTWLSRLDIGEFQLALLNLAVNARDAMAGSGLLVLSARNVSLSKPNPQGLDGDFVAMSVRDTGSGIAPDILSRVFEPFFTTKEVGKGTGLGLSQVYGFAKQAGGTATVESEVGQGTTVSLFLPRSVDPIDVEEQSVELSGKDGLARVDGRVTVLLVEDNPEVARVTKGYLEDMGYTIRSAADAAAARTILQDTGAQIDVVVSDIVMPGETHGLDLALSIRRDFGARLPVILATGYSDMAQAAADEGFTLLRKPYSAAELYAAISQALRSASKVVGAEEVLSV